MKAKSCFIGFCLTIKMWPQLSNGLLNEFKDKPNNPSKVVSSWHRYVNSNWLMGENLDITIQINQSFCPIYFYVAFYNVPMYMN